jgi:RNA polymerase sigma-70 factor (ECF subfamily)
MADDWWEWHQAGRGVGRRFSGAVYVAVLRKRPAGYIASVELEAVAESLAPRLIAYALARTGCRETAEDIAQEALTALVVRWRRAGPPESPDAYVFAIAKRRAGRAVARRALMAPLDALRGVARHEPGVEQSYEDRSELAIVLSAMRTLSRADREALLLRVAGELPFDEIAAVMHTSSAAVKMRVSRARGRLVALLAEHTDGRRTHTA